MKDADFSNAKLVGELMFVPESDGENAAPLDGPPPPPAPPAPPWEAEIDIPVEAREDGVIALDLGDERGWLVGSGCCDWEPV